MGLNRGIAFTMEKEGYQVFCARTLAQGRTIWDREKVDGIILDLNLPDGDGMDFCREVRRGSAVPMIMLTARDMEVDEIMGLESGADDYMTKPFSLAVLKVRIAKLMKRREREPELASGDLVLYPLSMKVRIGETELELSLTEFRLLKLFLENKNQVLTKEQILGRIWDLDGNFVDENTLPVNIRRLRKKIEADPSKPTRIKTVHGLGYLWEESE